jgi:hypothetical protein
MLFLFTKTLFLKCIFVIFIFVTCYRHLPAASHYFFNASGSGNKYDLHDVHKV